MRTSSTIAAAAITLALVTTSSAAAQAAPGTRSESPLRVAVRCGELGYRLDVAWRADSPTSSHSLRTDQFSYAYPAADGAGWQDEHVRFTAGDGPRTVTLVADGTDIATRTVTVPRCDAWAGLEGYLASGANTIGSTQDVGALTGRVEQGFSGNVVHEATDGDVVVLGDGTAHVVRGAIAAKWRALGGLRGRMLAPGSSEMETRDGSGYSTTFQNGSIWWSPATGAHAILGPAYGIGLDGTTWNPGPGYPTDDGVEVVRPDGTIRGRYQHFENAVSYRTMTGAGYVHAGPLLDTYARAGYESGRLGWPVADAEWFFYAQNAPDSRDSWRQRFENGAIYAPFNGGQPAHYLLGAIAAYYEGPDRQSFTTARRLGYPLTDELTTPDGVGRYAHFANSASVYWTQTTGAHAVLDQGYGFRAYYASRGWERSTLGYPAADQLDLTVPNRYGTTGAVQRFSRGNLYSRWRPTTDTRQQFSVTGSILAEYARNGWENSVLGYPISEEGPIRGAVTDLGTEQFFEGGTIVRDSRDGFAWTVLDTNPDPDR